MRGRQHLCVVSPQKNFLMLNTLRFANEVLPPAIKDTGSAAVSAAELAMAKQLVEGMSGAFKPEQFKDTYRADLLRKVKEKIKKKQTHSLEGEPDASTPRPKAQVIDLMEALKNSLKLKGSGTARSAPKKAARQRERA
jgi:DNA end-binding protein Ku